MFLWGHLLISKLWYVHVCCLPYGSLPRYIFEGRQGDQIGNPLSGFIHRSSMGMDSVVQFTRLFDSIFDEGTTPIDLAGAQDCWMYREIHEDHEVKAVHSDVICQGGEHLHLLLDLVSWWPFGWERCARTHRWPFGPAGPVGLSDGPDADLAGRTEFDEFIKKLAQKVLPKQSLFVMISGGLVNWNDLRPGILYRNADDLLMMYWWFTDDADDLLMMMMMMRGTNQPLIFLIYGSTASEDSYFDLEQGRWTSWEDLMEVRLSKGGRYPRNGKLNREHIYIYK